MTSNRDYCNEWERKRETGRTIKANKTSANRFMTITLLIIIFCFIRNENFMFVALNGREFHKISGKLNNGIYYYTRITHCKRVTSRVFLHLHPSLPSTLLLLLIAIACGDITKWSKIMLLGIAWILIFFALIFHVSLGFISCTQIMWKLFKLFGNTKLILNYFCIF